MEETGIDTLQEVKEPEPKEEPKTQDDKIAGKAINVKIPKGIVPDNAIWNRERMWEAAGNMIQRKLAPNNLDTPSKILVGFEKAYALGFRSFGTAYGAVQQMYVINNSVHIYGDLPMAILIMTGKATHSEDYLLDKDQNKICEENKNLLEDPHVAISKIHLTTGEILPGKFTIKQMEAEGLLTAKNREGRNKFPIWHKHTETMMMRRARAKAIKFRFPQIFFEVPILEYDGYRTEMKDVNVKNESLKQLEGKFNEDFNG